MGLSGAHRPAPRWLFHLRQAAWAGIDLIFPPQCGGCGKEGQRFCARCVASLEYIVSPLCAYCGYPARHAGVARCGVCRALPSGDLAGLRSAALFAGPLQRALHRLKYRRDVILADSLAQLLHTAWQQQRLPRGLVVPVPLSAERQRERGYNQAGLLARGFADLAGLPYRPAAAARVRHTASQVHLSAGARQQNVAGAFAARPAGVRGQTVLLVDDVCTTGATLAACAAALRAAGAVEVWGLTLGRARSPAHHAAGSGPAPGGASHRRQA